jgi:serine/threonine-protein kinase
LGAVHASLAADPDVAIWPSPFRLAFDVAAASGPVPVVEANGRASKGAMADPHLIGPVPPSTARTPSSGSRRRALPADLLRDASRRLGIMSLVACGLWTFGSVLGHLAERSVSHGDPQWRRLGGPDAIAALSVLVSLVLFAYTRKEHRDPERILDLGLAYLVFTAFALGLTFHWARMPANQSLSPTISWIGAVVLMFAAIVPSTPTKTMVAGVIAVSMNPIGMLIARARGNWNFQSPTDALFMHFPDYLLLGVAVVISHVVTRLGQQVARAREMGSYQLGKLLGRGGMGEVYHATHRMLARPAAIELIRPEMMGGSDPAAAQLAVRRFRREAEPRRPCGRRTRWNCTTLASQTTRRSISSWNCWRA